VASTTKGRQNSRFLVIYEDVDNRDLTGPTRQYLGRNCMTATFNVSADVA
jgi:hypothetical protein